jgi:hypothetical protein
MRRLTVVVSCLAVLIAGLVAVVAGSPAVSGAPVAPATPQQPGTFHPVEPTRVLDTRTGIGLAPTIEAVFMVVDHGGIPESASAAVVNITVLNPARSGSVSVFPGTAAWNGAASISFLAGHTKQSMVTATLGTNGTLAVRNNVAVPLELIADVVGYYTGGTPSTPGSFQAVGFRRVFDTRATGAHPLPAGSATRVPIAGRAGLPASGMGAVVANLTVVNPARAGSVSAYASGTAWDGSASESFAAARSEQDVLTVGLGADGAAIIRNNTAGPLTVVLDVIGYYLSGAPTGYGSYQPIAPVRILDQRVGPQPSRAGQVIQVNPLTEAHPASSIPVWGVPAVVVRITVITPARAGSVSAYRIDRSWNGAATMSFPAGVSAQQQIVAPLGAAGTLQIRNNLAVPIIMVADVLGYYLGVTNPFRVTSSADLEPSRGLMTDVSCATATFCMTTQAGGYVETWNGSAWTVPSKVPGVSDLHRLSCVSATFCEASGVDGDNNQELLRFDGAQWTVDLANPTGAYQLSRLSCASASFCMASGGNAYRTFDGVAWSALAYRADSSVHASLSCPVAGFCMALDTTGRWSEFAGSSWSTPATITGVRLRAVDCTSSSFCVAVAPGTAALFDGTGWTVTSSLTGASTLSWVSCVSSSECFGLGRSGAVIRFDGHSWSGPTLVDGQPTTGVIDCASAGVCAVVGTWFDPPIANAATFDGTSWSSPQQLDIVPGRLTDISCASTSFCAAVDSSGYVMRYDGSSWSAPAQIDGGVGLTGVSCTSSSRCVAVDERGRALGYDGSSWSSPVAVDSVSPLAVSCSGASFCATVGANGAASTFDGTAWTAAAPVTAQAFAKVSCAGPAFCLAIDQRGGTAVFDGAHWSAGPDSAIPSPSSLSCPSSSYCVAADSITARQWSNGSWTTIEVGNTQSVPAISCPSAQWCVSPLTTAVSDPDLVVAWDGAEWTMPASQPITPGFEARVISCPATDFCMITEGGTVDRLDS